MWCVEGSAGKREVCVEVGAEDGLHGTFGDRLGRRKEGDGLAQEKKPRSQTLIQLFIACSTKS